MRLSLLNFQKMFKIIEMEKPNEIHIESAPTNFNKVIDRSLNPQSQHKFFSLYQRTPVDDNLSAFAAIHKSSQIRSEENDKATALKTEEQPNGPTGGQLQKRDEEHESSCSSLHDQVEADSSITDEDIYVPRQPIELPLPKMSKPYNHFQEWLNSLDCSKLESAVEEKVQQPQPLTFDSDDEEQSSVDTNPFAQYLNETAPEPNELPSGNVFHQRLQSKLAVPDYALSDAVFCVDKPKNAVKLGQKLPPLKLEHNCQVNGMLKIAVCEVYTPFQFWFHFVNELHDISLLAELSTNINTFYNNLADPKKTRYNQNLPNFFLKSGYICAICQNHNWRRARIVSTPLTQEEYISIYYVDYGGGAEVPRSELKFLPSSFAETPALAVRGCLSHIHPFELHWPRESIIQFKRLALSRELFAQLMDLDLEESILYLRLSFKENLSPTINWLMHKFGLAGKTDHYNKRTSKNNCGRRLRYLRERLPSFDMLESRVFPQNDAKFEQEFDDIVYKPSFYDKFELPINTNPFRASLFEALATWMTKYKKEELMWRKLYREADRKIRKQEEANCGT